MRVELTKVVTIGGRRKTVKNVAQFTKRGFKRFEEHANALGYISKEFDNEGNEVDVKLYKVLPELAKPTPKGKKIYIEDSVLKVEPSEANEIDNMTRAELFDLAKNLDLKVAKNISTDKLILKIKEA